MVLKVQEVVYPILRFKEEKQTFIKIKRGNLDFLSRLVRGHFSMSTTGPGVALWAKSLSPHKWLFWAPRPLSVPFRLTGRAPPTLEYTR